MKVLSLKKEVVKRTYIIGLFILGTMGIHAQIHDVKVKVNGIRSETGNILIMAQKDKESQPIYSSVRAKRGQVTLLLKGLTEEKYMLSVFHDENSNWQLDMNEQKQPLEGVAQCYYQVEPGKSACEMTLYYLPNPE